MKFELFVPGRFCLFGEHTDTIAVLGTELNDIPNGATLVTPIDLGIKAEIEYKFDKPKEGEYGFIIISEKVSKSPSDQLGITSISQSIILEKDNLQEWIDNNSYYRYIAGTLLYIMTNNKDVGEQLPNYKIYLNLESTLPVRHGLSSSAAICVLIVKMVNEILDLKLTMNGIMNYAWNGERLTGSMCGKLDQIVAYPERKMVHISHNKDKIYINDIVHIEKELNFVYVMTDKNKKVADILNSISDAYRHDSYSVTDALIENYYYQNTSIINLCETYLALGDIKAIGELMTYSQLGFRHLVANKDRALLEDTIIDKLYASDSIVQHYSCGYKGIGAHGDRSGAFLCMTKDKAIGLNSYINKSYDYLYSIIITIPEQ